MATTTARPARTAKALSLGAAMTGTNARFLPNGQPNPNYRGNTGVNGGANTPVLSDWGPGGVIADQTYVDPNVTTKPIGTTTTTNTQRPGQIGSRLPNTGTQVQPFNAAAQVGHDGKTALGMNREAYRDKWMSSGAKSLADLQKFIAQYGGTLDSANGTVLTPFGEKIDMGIGARKGAGQMKPGWGATGADAVAKAQANAQMAGRPVPAGTGGGTTGTGGQVPGVGGGAPMPAIASPGAFSYTPMANLAPVQAQQMQAAQIGQPGTITAAQIAAPSTIKGQTVQGPQALNAERFALPDAFKAPTAEDLYADPSYQVRLEEGLKAQSANRAMQGVLRTGGVAKQLQQYGQEQASKEYGNVYARKKGEYDTSLGAAMGANAQNNATAAQAYGLTNQYQQQAALANQQNAYQVDATNTQNQMQRGMFNAGNQQQANIANVGNQMQAGMFNAGNQQQAAQFNAGNRAQTDQFNQQSALAQNAQQYGQAQGAWQGNMNAALGQGNLNLGYQQANNAYALGKGNLDLGYTQAANTYALGQGQLGLQQGAQNWMQNTQFPWQQQYQIANMGLTAAQLQAGYGGQYGQNAGNIYMGQGNADAAGHIGAGNAWNNAWTGVGNAGQDAFSLWYANQGSGA